MAKRTDLAMEARELWQEQTGQTTRLRVKVSPENPTRKELQWASSDKSVATVDQNGNVTAVGRGTAKVGVRAASGVTDVCNVRVN